ncbi:hypothetical protein [uncultured Sphaerotilus sp.]|uniref:hypothetical protein n=1 Tax=uncultured Sphaerotilus sp. TaxID=474984 RepID=UPI0030CA1B2D
MNSEDSFLLQLAKAIQTWLWIEGELYSLYSMFMQGANSHLISATFNSIQSVDAKLALLNCCFTLVFERGSDDLKSWRKLVGKLEKLNKQRNKIVHEPVSLHYSRGVLSEVKIGPSYSNSLALAKGQTTHQGKPVVSADYDPSKVYILEDHRLTQTGVSALERTFKAAALEMRAYRELVAPKVASALQAAQKPRK